MSEEGNSGVTASRSSVTYGRHRYPVEEEDVSRITSTPAKQEILRAWMASHIAHHFETIDDLREALQATKGWYLKGSELPSLFHPQNLAFLTEEEGREPSLYFIRGNATGRIRQQHAYGPAVDVNVDAYHYFFNSEVAIEDFEYDVEAATVTRERFYPKRELHRYSRTPATGSWHYEISYRHGAEGGKIDMSHRSGGRVLTDLRWFTDERVAEIYRRAIGRSPS
jgi:hypothetical protein